MQIICSKVFWPEMKFSAQPAQGKPPISGVRRKRPISFSSAMIFLWANHTMTPVSGIANFKRFSARWAKMPAQLAKAGLSGCDCGVPRIKCKAKRGAERPKAHGEAKAETLIVQICLQGAGFTLGKVCAGAGSNGVISGAAGWGSPGFLPLATSPVSQKNSNETAKIVTSAMPINGPLCHLFCFSISVCGADMVLPFLRFGRQIGHLNQCV